ncbi:SHOCT domain-containing protein [Candidatus Pristimantibacillus sp. PTI5]|uniref:SHOCT domain-containing protein n=1 Tax=Candidatus Pristimantibacillus sp. PTI5 TaxID=3400422 RepID=UPI003B010768
MVEDRNSLPNTEEITGSAEDDVTIVEVEKPKDRLYIGCVSIYFIISILISIWTFTWSDASGRDTNFFGWCSVVILLVLIPFIAWLGDIENKDKEKKVNELNDRYKNNLENHLDFKVSSSFKAVDYETSISVDESSKAICIMHSGLSNSKTFSYKDIIEVQIIEDGYTISKTSRGSQIGGAVIGGVLTGGVGAIIGGLSGDAVQTSKVKRIDLKLIVNDTTKPVFLINFMNELDEKSGMKFKMGVTKESEKYKLAIEQVRHWHGLISVLIKRADDEEKGTNKNIVGTRTEGNHEKTANSSVADELTKLYDLHTKGIISKEEFENQKAKVLSN